MLSRINLVSHEGAGFVDLGAGGAIAGGAIAGGGRPLGNDFGTSARAAVSRRSILLDFSAKSRFIKAYDMSFYWAQQELSKHV